MYLIHRCIIASRYTQTYVHELLVCFTNTMKYWFQFLFINGAELRVTTQDLAFCSNFLKWQLIMTKPSRVTKPWRENTRSNFVFLSSSGNSSAKTLFSSEKNTPKHATSVSKTQKVSYVLKAARKHTLPYYTFFYQWSRSQ